MRLCLAILLAGAALAQPQPPQQPKPPQPPQMGALKAYLNLTDVQLMQMHQAGEQAGRQAGEKMKALETQMREKHATLAAMMAKPGGDPAAVGKLMLEIRDLDKQAHQIGQAPREALLSVLSAEQKTRFKAIEDAALLPAATREAMMMGLVPHAQGGPSPARQPHMRRMQGMRGPQGPRPGMQPGPQGGPMRQNMPQNMRQNMRPNMGQQGGPGPRGPNQPQQQPKPPQPPEL